MPLLKKCRSDLAAPTPPLLVSNWSSLFFLFLSFAGEPTETWRRKGDKTTTTTKDQVLWTEKKTERVCVYKVYIKRIVFFLVYF